MSVPWQSPSPLRFRFGEFEFDPRGLELWRGGQRVALRTRPAQVLAALLSSPGEVVTHAELQRLVWGDQVHVELGQSLKSCVRQIRHALGDDARDPKYVETLPRRGYRFLAPVRRTGTATHGLATAGAAVHGDVRQRTNLGGLLVAVASVVVLIVLTGRWDRLIHRDIGQPVAPGHAVVETRSPAYSPWIEANRLLAEGGAGGHVRAIALLRLAERLDPEFAAAPATLALTYAETPALPAAERYPAAIASAERALDLNDRLPEALLARGLARFAYLWDWPGARADYERAVEIDPGFAEAHAALGWWHAAARQPRAARAALARAVEIDPTNGRVRAASGWAYYFARQYADAVRECTLALRLQPQRALAADCVLAAALADGQVDRAAAALRESLIADQAPRQILQQLEIAEPSKVLREGLRLRLHLPAQSPLDSTLFAEERALPLLWLGDTESALAAITQAAHVRSGWYLPFLGVAPFVDPIRSDLRLERVLHTMHLAHECTLSAAQARQLPLDP